MEPATILAIAAAGTEILGQMSGQHAAKKERDYWRRMMRKTMWSPEAKMGLRTLRESREALKTAPGMMRRRMEGALASEAQQRTRRLQTAMAMSGATMAGAPGATQARGIAGDIERERQLGELGIMEYEQSMRNQIADMARAVQGMRFPQIGQSAAGLGRAPGYYTNPASALTSAVMGYGMGKYFQDPDRYAGFGGMPKGAMGSIPMGQPGGLQYG
jgi:hypothetical protein